MSQKTRVLNFLEAGNTLTEDTAIANGIKNVREVVRTLREEGNAIYYNTRASGNSFYRLGAPSKRMVATAYKALGAHAFN